MFFLTSESLRQILSDVPEFELKAGALLAQCPLPIGPDSSIPADEKQLVEATIELLDIARETESAVRRLSGVSPVPVDLPDDGFSL